MVPSLKRCFLCLLPVFFIVTELPSLSPGTLARHRGYIWNGLDYTNVFGVADQNGNTKSLSAHFITNQLYVVYGVMKDFNLWLGFDFKVSFAQNDTDVGLADGRVGVKYSLFKKILGLPFGAAAETHVKFPLSGYETGKINAFGDNQSDLSLGLILGYKLDPVPVRLALGGGYIVRFSEPPDQFYGAFEVSTKLTTSWGLKFKLLYLRSLSGIDYASPEFNQRTIQNKEFPFPSLRSTYLILALEAEYYLNSDFTLGIQTNASLYTRNAGTIYKLGFSLGYLI